LFLEPGDSVGIILFPFLKRSNHAALSSRELLNEASISTLTRILLEELFGVISTDRPETGVNVALAIVAASVFTACTTCTTCPGMYVEPAPVRSVISDTFKRLIVLSPE
jgi:hypothetical protein